MRWGDLHRNGYHTGITHVHHFYTRRNLIALGALWKEAEKYPEHLSLALKFWILTYNSTHSTLMTRVVAKQKQRDLVVTSGQSGVLYISGLPVEKNIFSGLKRKLKTVANAFYAIKELEGSVVIEQRSCTSVDLPDKSVDYVFTDPPFGGNIPYSEVNFINEAWLNSFTDPADEIIINNSQDKNVESYEKLMIKAFKELYRITKKNTLITLVFHSAEASVWNALRKAYETAGFGVSKSSVLDKKQGSFKQVTAAGTVKGDPIFLLTKKKQPAAQASAGIWEVTKELLRVANTMDDLNEKSPQRLYSRLVTHYLSNRQHVPIDADTFYEEFRKRFGKQNQSSLL
jgi:adenine-specific DNA methylase